MIMFATEGEIIVGGHFGVMSASVFFGLYFCLHLCGLLDTLIYEYLFFENVVDHAFPTISGDFFVLVITKILFLS